VRALALASDGALWVGTSLWLGPLGGTDGGLGRLDAKGQWHTQGGRSIYSETSWNFSEKRTPFTLVTQSRSRYG